MSFNGRRDHHGTMWESRYRVRVKDPAECGMMLAESGYVDANSVNAAKSPQQKYALTKDGKRRIERVAPL
jgi:hypothetical protein